ncbi:hypothetical protein QCD71_20235 [Sphingomonas sp. PsM26]|nr:hypothetical protein [Sphingomonas sp. PsM26]
MAKALKFAAIAVGAVALAFTGVGLAAGLGAAATSFGVGVSASTLFLVSGGLSIAAGLLQKGPKVTASQTDRLTANINPRTFRKTVLGQTAMPVDVRYEQWSGKDQEICDWIVAFASHAIDGLEEIWFDTEMAWSATTGVVAKYNGYFSIPNLILEGTPQNAFTFGQWNRNSARLTGCAYARFRFKVTGNSKKAESPFSSGIPSRITVIGRGAKLYDPRRDSTVPGGSGPMRADDQSTWRFKTDDGVVIGENLPLQILRVILGWRIRNPASGVMKLATGAGVPMRRISLPSFQVAANLADELVNRAAGGNEPRYHGAGVISEGDDHKTVLDMLCTACCGRFRDTGGKLSLSISHNDLATAALDDGLNDDDVVGAFTWDPDPSLETTPNVVRGRYVDATSASLYQLIDYPEVRLPSPDGQDRYLSLDLGVVESPSHAQRVAKQVLQRRQYSRQFAAPFDIRAWKYTVGDVLPFTFAPLGFKRGVFRVKEQELGQGGTCNMVLTFETPVFYQWDADDSLPVQGAEPIVYDRANNPLILAIDEAATTAFWNGVTGDGKPADDATNSADPNSPFGPGTVGGAIAQLTEFDLQIAAAHDQLEDIDGTTIPAINKAVADAGARIETVKKDADDALSSAVALLTDSDAKINRRIDSVAAAGGYDDTSVRAEIKRVDETAVSRDGTISRRIDSVVTDYNAGDVATNGRIDQVATTASDAKKAVSDLSTSVDTNFRGINSTLTNYDQRISGLATDAQGYAGRTTKLEAAAMSGGVYLNANPTYVIWPDGQRLASGWLDWNGPTNLSVGRGIDTTRLDSPYYMSTNQTAPDINIGHYQTLAACKEAGWYVFTAEADLVAGRWEGSGLTLGGGYNLDFAGTADQAGDISATKMGNRRWTLLFQKPKDTAQNFHAMQSWDGFGRPRPQKVLSWRHASIRPANDGEIKAGRADAALPLVAARVKVTEDTLADLPNRYAASARAATLEAQVQGTADSNLLARANDRAAAIADSKVGSVVQSVNTLSALVLNSGVNLLPNSSGENGGVNTGSAYQWSAGGGAWYSGVSTSWGQRMQNDAPTGNVISIDGPRILCSPNTSYTASGDLLLISDLSNPSCYVDIVFERLDGSLFYPGGGRPVRGSRDFGSSGFRDATWMTAKAPADAAKVFMRGIFASDQAGSHRNIGIRQAKLEVGPGPYTPYSQEGTLQQASAQLAIASGAIAGLDGRSSVYWSVTGTTPDGSTRIQLSKANGSAGLFYVEANMLLNGNLTVDGTITARKFDRNSMSREGTSVWQGSVSPPAGSTVSVPWGLGLSQIPGLGRFIYEYQTQINTNVGQRQTTTMNGKPAYLDYVSAGGGVNIVARDNQGNEYRPKANSSAAVLATTDFVPSWTATVTNGAYDTGWIDQGDYYSRQVAGTYTVTLINLKVTWVAI